MAGQNVTLVALFREMAQLAELEEGSPNAFRVRAYETAMEAIQNYPGDLEKLSERELTRIDGIGKSTASRIREFFQTGRIQRLEELRRKYPPEFVELGKIPGLGPKTLVRLRAEAGIENLNDLRAALQAQKLRHIKGLGAKVEENILHAIERMGATGKEQRTPIARALPFARELVAQLEAFPEVERACYCGSLRRLRETVADVDIVVASRSPAVLMEKVVKLPAVAEILARGETKTSVLTTIGLQVDVRIVKPEQFGAACQYFTGSKAHNIKLRQMALERGWLLNEYGLTEVETGKIIASESEEAIYDALGLPPIPAPMREDRGEIELAAEGKLPAAIDLAELRGDLHLHTHLSGDGRSSLEEMAASAAERGYAYIAITDHGEDLAFNGVDREKLLVQRGMIRKLQERYPKMTLLQGCELNIGPDGSLDYDPEFRSGLDWRIAGVHSHFDLDRARQTARILKAMEDPTVDAIAHLSGRRIGRRQGIDLDVDAVLRKAVETGTAIEINAALGRLDAASEVLYRARDLDVTFVVSTDSHHTRELERMEWGALQATRGWVPREKVANTWPKKRFLEWLGRRPEGRRRPRIS